MSKVRVSALTYGAMDGTTFQISVGNDALRADDRKRIEAAIQLVEDFGPLDAIRAKLEMLKTDDGLHLESILVENCEYHNLGGFDAIRKLIEVAKEIEKWFEVGINTLTILPDPPKGNEPVQESNIEVCGAIAAISNLIDALDAMEGEHNG